MCVPLPDGVFARDVFCNVANAGAVTIGLKHRGSAAGSDGTEGSLVVGTLFESISSSVWSVEKGMLTGEIEKTRPKLWPCALQGHPEIDVNALATDEKAEALHKLGCDLEAQPRRVNDRETLLKLKAEFPQLSDQLAVENIDVTTHRNHVGPRKTFEWGALPQV